MPSFKDQVIRDLGEKLPGEDRGTSFRNQVLREVADDTNAHGKGSSFRNQVLRKLDETPEERLGLIDKPMGTSIEAEIHRLEDIVEQKDLGVTGQDDPGILDRVFDVLLRPMYASVGVVDELINTLDDDGKDSVRQIFQGFADSRLGVADPVELAKGLYKFNTRILPSAVKGEVLASAGNRPTLPQRVAGRAAREFFSGADKIPEGIVNIAAAIPRAVQGTGPINKALDFALGEVNVPIQKLDLPDIKGDKEGFLQVQEDLGVTEGLRDSQMVVPFWTPQMFYSADPDEYEKWYKLKAGGFADTTGRGRTALIGDLVVDPTTYLGGFGRGRDAVAITVRSKGGKEVTKRLLSKEGERIFHEAEEIIFPVRNGIINSREIFPSVRKEIEKVGLMERFKNVILDLNKLTPEEIDKLRPAYDEARRVTDNIVSQAGRNGKKVFKRRTIPRAVIEDAAPFMRGVVHYAETMDPKHIGVGIAHTRNFMDKATNIGRSIKSSIPVVRDIKPIKAARAVKEKFTPILSNNPLYKQLVEQEYSNTAYQLGNIEEEIGVAFRNLDQKSKSKIMRAFYGLDEDLAKFSDEEAALNFMNTKLENMKKIEDAAKMESGLYRAVDANGKLVDAGLLDGTTRSARPLYFNTDIGRAEGLVQKVSDEVLTGRTNLFMPQRSTYGRVWTDKDTLRQTYGSLLREKDLKLITSPEEVLLRAASEHLEAIGDIRFKSEIKRRFAADVAGVDLDRIFKRTRHLGAPLRVLDPKKDVVIGRAADAVSNSIRNLNADEVIQAKDILARTSREDKVEIFRRVFANIETHEDLLRTMTWLKETNSLDFIPAFRNSGAKSLATESKVIKLAGEDVRVPIDIAYDLERAPRHVLQAPETNAFVKAYDVFSNSLKTLLTAGAIGSKNPVLGGTIGGGLIGGGLGGLADGDLEGVVTGAMTGATLGAGSGALGKLAGANAIPIFPSFHVRNAYGNVALSYLNVGLRTLDGERNRLTRELMKIADSPIENVFKNRKIYKVSATGETMTHGRLVQDLKELGIIQSQRDLFELTGASTPFADHIVDMEKAMKESTKDILRGKVKIEKFIRERKAALRRGDPINSKVSLSDMENKLKEINDALVKQRRVDRLVKQKKKATRANKREQVGTLRLLLGDIGEQFNLNALSDMNKAQGRKVGTYIENHARINLYLANLERGLSRADAASNVQKFLFNYGLLSDVEKKFMRRLFPFYTFTRKNIPLQVGALIDEPARQALKAKLLSTPERHKDDLPTWQFNNGSIRLSEDNKSIYTLRGIDLPIQQLSMLDSVFGLLPGRSSDRRKAGTREIVSMMHPLVKRALIEDITNTDIFSAKSLDRKQLRALGVVVDKFPEPLKKWLRFKSSVNKNTGKTHYSMDGAKWFALADMTMFSRVLGQPDAVFRESVKDPGWANMAARWLSGINLEEISKDEVYYQRLQERKRQLERLTSKGGETFEFKKSIPTRNR